MHYKTIVHQLLEENEKIHQGLSSSGSLLSTIEQLALELRNSHHAILDQLRAHYQITENLPEQLKSSLPTIEQIEAELGGFDDE